MDALIQTYCTNAHMEFLTDDLDIDCCTGSSQFVLQGHFVLSCISVKTTVHLQVTGSILLPVGQILTCVSVEGI